MANKNAVFPGPGPGRPPGVQNKLTMQIKDMVRRALDQAGGVDYLVKQAHKSPNAFLTLLGRVIPSELNAHITGGVTVNIKQYSPLAANPPMTEDQKYLETIDQLKLSS